MSKGFGSGSSKKKRNVKQLYLDNQFAKGIFKENPIIAFSPEFLSSALGIPQIKGLIDFFALHYSY